jgi:hypothetical protein
VGLGLKKYVLISLTILIRQLFEACYRCYFPGLGRLKPAKLRVMICAKAIVIRRWNEDMTLKRTSRFSMLGTAAVALSLALAGPVSAAGDKAGAPRSIHASAGNRAATISWKAPTSDGGFPVLYYIVRAHPSGAACKTKGLKCTFHGLKGVKYTFTVDAITRAGVGTSSGHSNPVIPAAPAPPTTTTTQPPV